MRAKPVRLTKAVLGITSTALLFTSLLPGCGGGGGSGGASPNDLLDVPILVMGSPGRLSLTPTEANASNGTAPLPTFTPSVTTENHWFRLEFQFKLVPSSLLSTDPLYAPFSQLNGNLTIVDENGAHVPGLALIDGRDAAGVNHGNDIGFPHDLLPNGVDQNLGKHVFLFVADADGDLSTPAPFGGYLPDPGNPNAIIEDTTSTITKMRANLFAVNGQNVSGAWAFTIGIADTQQPFVTSIGAEERDPNDPLNPNSTSASGSLVVTFSEPMVPRTVGRSAVLDGAPFTGNMPNIFTGMNQPTTAIVATVVLGNGTLLVPFDCNPLNVNNLTSYRLKPLISLPSKIFIDVVILALTTNAIAAIDLAGNSFDGQDSTGDGVGDQVDHLATFKVGLGRAVVNIPVSPEVVYFLPSVGPGIGAIDLNGWGFGTNAPGANAGRFEIAPLVTKSWLDTGGIETNPGGLNLANGIGLLTYPGKAATPIDPFTGLPMLEFACNSFYFPLGLGSFPYGPTQNAERARNGEFPDKWDSALSAGNAGTLVPGVNEGSSGFETLCRNSDGDAILTGRGFTELGTIQDMIVGDFLDRVYFDKFNLRASASVHIAFFAGGAGTSRNLISEPPVPNPPPTRYWSGLPQIDVNFDVNSEGAPGVLLEGDEVWTGHRPNGPGALSGVIGAGNGAAYSAGYVHLLSNTLNPGNGVDQTLFPHQWGPNGLAFGNGPGAQSSTAVFTYASRQQIGNFLYVTDASSRLVHAVNSNTMRVISSISLPDPTGLGMAPDMSYLYVTNSSDDSLSVIGCDPTGSDFHREVARIPCGVGPRGIAVQQENEDIFVCNYLGNTVSIVDPASLSIRKTIDSLISGPWDVEVSPRQEQPTSPHPSGWQCGLYFSYISNLTGNSVVVYESGPDGPRGIGINNIRGSLPIDDSGVELIAPRGLCYSPFANPSGLFAGGVFVAHQDETGNGRVSHIQFTQQAIFGPLVVQVPPGFFIPPGFTDRVFEIVGTWGNTATSRLAGHIPSDVSLADMNTASYQSKPAGAPNFGGLGDAPQYQQTGSVNSKNFLRIGPQSASVALIPDRLYIGFEDSDQIQVVSPAQPGLILKTIEGHGAIGTKRLGTFWRE